MTRLSVGRYVVQRSKINEWFCVMRGSGSLQEKAGLPSFNPMRERPVVVPCPPNVTLMLLVTIRAGDVNE